jgi:solute carrier family 45, member 1/2/4
VLIGSVKHISGMLNSIPCTFLKLTSSRFTDPEQLDESTDKLGEIGRVGSLALVIFSIISFAASVVLPFMIHSPDENERKRVTATKIPAIFATCFAFLQRKKPQLLTAWFASHILFAIAQLAAPFVRSFGFATAIVATAGIPWALAMWAPFAFMGVEINRLTAPNAAISENGDIVMSSGGAYQRAQGDDPDPENSENQNDRGSAEHERLNSEKPLDDDEPDDLAEDMEELHLNHNMPAQVRNGDEDEDLELAEGEILKQPEADLDDASTGETAGVYMGILNLYAAGPQLLGTVINMIVFAIVEPGRNPELAHTDAVKEIVSHSNGTVTIRSPGFPAYSTRSLFIRDHNEEPPVVNAIAVCMFIGGLASFGAAYATWRLKHVR